MRRRSATELLAGHALAGGKPLGALMRRRGADHAARMVEAGQLQRGLRILGVSAELAALAERWPPALAPAQVRAARLPSLFALRLPLILTLAYILLVIRVHTVGLWVLGRFVQPTLLKMGLELRLGDLATVLTASDVLSWSLFLLALWLAKFSWRLPFERRHLGEAETAASAAALIESGAPAGVSARFAASAPIPLETATIPELDALIAQHVAAVTAAHHRLVVLVRVVGFGGLALVSAGIVAAMMRVISRVPSL